MEVMEQDQMSKPIEENAFSEQASLPLENNSENVDQNEKNNKDIEEKNETEAKYQQIQQNQTKNIENVHEFVQNQLQTIVKQQKIENSLEQHIEPIMEMSFGNNPEDKALQLAYKMINMKKERAKKQQQIIQQIRLKRQKQEFETIKRQQAQKLKVYNTIKQNRLRSSLQYPFSINSSRMKSLLYSKRNETTFKKQNSIFSTLQPIQETMTQTKKKAMQHEIQILKISQGYTIKYQIKKYILSIIHELIDRSVDIYEKKYQFFFKMPPKKISEIIHPQFPIEEHQPQIRINKIQSKGVNTEQHDGLGGSRLSHRSQINQVYNISLKGKSDEDQSESNSNSQKQQQNDSSSQNDESSQKESSQKSQEQSQNSKQSSSQSQS